MKKYLAAAAVCVFLCSCATPGAVVKDGYDFSAVRTVRAGVFTSDRDYNNSGDAVQTAFMRRLLANGFNVVADPNAPADAVIEGSVTIWQPDQRFLVNTAGGGAAGVRRGRVIYGQPSVVQISGSNAYDLGPAFGMGPGNRIVASNATVGISAFMTDAQTGKVVWSFSYTYEGIDLASALDGAVRFIVRTIPRTANTAN
ncbi:MAG: hypothetical protein FWC57_06600 [Endomicrobia bacterium]|nr:hypothetical protein [Endomicrobiia bacterium]